MSVKSKKDLSRCPHSVKDGNTLCGIHLRAKNVQIYQAPQQQQEPEPVIEPESANISDPVPHVREINHSSASASASASSSIDRVVLKPRKKNMDMTNATCIIQRWIRRIWRTRCESCCNDADFITFEKLVDIPYPFVYFLHVATAGVTQGYDIRSLMSYIHESKKENPTKPIKNPYTCEIISDANITRMEHRVQVLRLNAHSIAAREEIPTNPEIQFRQYVLSIFQKMDFLDNYTNMDWFLNLSMVQLKNLYFGLIDIWEYRAQLTHVAKCRIVNNGFAFPVHEKIVKRMPDTPKNMRHIQKIIIREMDRLISEGISRDDRKLGCMLILTALVEVSPDAAAALPQFIQ